MGKSVSSITLNFQTYLNQRCEEKRNKIQTHKISHKLYFRASNVNIYDLLQSKYYLWYQKKAHVNICESYYQTKWRKLILKEISFEIKILHF